MVQNVRKLPGKRFAIAMVEVLIGVLILSFGLIPIYSIFTSSRKTVFKSEVSYLALHAARERLDEIQLLPLSVLLQLSAEGESPWTPVAGSAFTVLVNATSSLPDPAPMKDNPELPPSTLLDPKYTYPENYERIKLKTHIELLPVVPIASGSDAPAGPPWLFKVSVKVRWQEKGEDVQAKEDQGLRIFKSRFERIFGISGTAERDYR